MPTLLFATFVSISLCASPADRWSYVDPEGILRWRDDRSEVALFGVNYYAPFTVDHEGLRLLGEDHRLTMDRDVAHFVRLGLDAIRLHVFDRQISDKRGNLLKNEHLDLFDPTSLKREVSRVLWVEHSMTIRLPDLGKRFQFCRITPDHQAPSHAADGCFRVTPGAYVLTRDGVAIPKEVTSDYWAPRPQYQEPAVWWQAPARWRQEVPLPVRVNVAATEIEEVRLHLDGAGGFPLDEVAPYVYAADVPVDRLRAGAMFATLEVRSAEASNWCSHNTGMALDRSASPFTVCQIHGDEAPPLRGPDGCHAEIVDGCVLRITAQGFRPSAAAGCRLPAEPPSDSTHNTLVLRARALHEATDRVELGLVQSDGKAYGTDVPLWTEWHDARIPLADLHPLWGTPPGQFDVTLLEQVSFVFGAWLYGPNREQRHGYEVERCWLEKRPSGWKIEIADADGPVLLFAAGDRPVRSNGQQDRHQKLVRGSRPGWQADRLWTNGFGAPPSCISFRQTVPESLTRFVDSLRRCNALQIVARATTPQTNKLEVALVERDSTAWGTTVPLTQKWERIVVPLESLRFFSHWAHPEGRGGKIDRLRVENLAAVNFCFGAWLFGNLADRPHGIEVESASLVRREE